MSVTVTQADINAARHQHGGRVSYDTISSYARHREQAEREAEARIVAWIREKALSAWGADCSGMDEITFIATTISQGAHKQ